MPVVRITRDSGWVDHLRSYSVLVDGESAATVDDGGSVELELPPGDHELRLRLDFCHSKPVKVSLGDDPVELACGSHMRGWRVMLASLYLLLHRDEWMWLDHAHVGVPAPPL